MECTSENILSRDREEKKRWNSKGYKIMPLLERQHAKKTAEWYEEKDGKIRKNCRKTKTIIHSQW